MVMRLHQVLRLSALAAILSLAASAQQQTAPPRSDDRSPGESSSKDSMIDLSPPMGDAKSHPNSGVADELLDLRPFDPHRAMKNVEVGDYYFRQKNYRAAASRYREALAYKPNDAIATFKLATALEKTGDLSAARIAYEEYLRVLPNGPSSTEAKAALSRIPESKDAPKPIPELKPDAPATAK